MTITQVVDLAKRLHDAEGWDLGISSTREGREAFWARVIGCAYHGHPVYNPHPDRQWHLKRGSASRPPTDDVATSMPTRWAWDCIAGAGTEGYRFVAHEIGALPSDQVVYAPPVPAETTPAPSPVQPYPSESPIGGWWGQVADVQIAERYAQVGRPYPSDQTSLRWIGRIAYDIRDGLTKEAALAKHLTALEQELGL